MPMTAASGSAIPATWAPFLLYGRRDRQPATCLRGETAEAFRPRAGFLPMSVGRRPPLYCVRLTVFGAFGCPESLLKRNRSSETVHP